MGRRFAEIAFTPLVKEKQRLHGSRHQYERVENSNDPRRPTWSERAGIHSRT